MKTARASLKMNRLGETGEKKRRVRERGKRAWIMAIMGVAAPLFVHELTA
jgi:hypothetical protein